MEALFIITIYYCILLAPAIQKLRKFERGAGSHRPVSGIEFHLYSWCEQKATFSFCAGLISFLVHADQFCEDNPDHEVFTYDCPRPPPPFPAAAAGDPPAANHMYPSESSAIAQGSRFCEVALDMILDARQKDGATLRSTFAVIWTHNDGVFDGVIVKKSNANMLISAKNH